MSWFKRKQSAPQTQYVRTEETVQLEKANIKVKLLSGEAIDISVSDEMREQTGVLNGETVQTKTRFTLARDRVKALENYRSEDRALVFLLSPTKEIIVPTSEISQIEVELEAAGEDTAVYYKQA